MNKIYSHILCFPCIGSHRGKVPTQVRARNMGRTGQWRRRGSLGGTGPNRMKVWCSRGNKLRCQIKLRTMFRAFLLEWKKDTLMYYVPLASVPIKEKFPRLCGHETWGRMGSEGGVGGTGPSRMKMWCRRDNKLRCQMRLLTMFRAFVLECWNAREVLSYTMFPSLPWKFTNEMGYFSRSSPMVLWGSFFPGMPKVVGSSRARL